MMRGAERGGEPVSASDERPDYAAITEGQQAVWAAGDVNVLALAIRA